MNLKNLPIEKYIEIDAYLHQVPIVIYTFTLMGMCECAYHST